MKKITREGGNQNFKGLGYSSIVILMSDLLLEWMSKLWRASGTIQLSVKLYVMALLFLPIMWK